MKIIVIGGTGLIGSKLVENCAGLDTRRSRRRRTPALTSSPARVWPKRSTAPRS